MNDFLRPRDIGVTPYLQAAGAGGPVIRNPQPVAARIPVYCRREDGRSFQGQPPPPCDGIFTDVSKGVRQCPKCGLTHAFAVLDGELKYGACL